MGEIIPEKMPELEGFLIGKCMTDKRRESLIAKLVENNSKRLHRFTDIKAAGIFIESLYRLLFVQDLQEVHDAARLHAYRQELEEQLEELLLSTRPDRSWAAQHTEAFFCALTDIYDLLLLDAGAILESDPAAQSLDEVLAAYPGFYATAIYRFSHQLLAQGVQLLPRVFTEYAHSRTGIDIHPGAAIGHSLAIDHGTGVVIGETAMVGNRVKIYQGVTLGALQVSRAARSRKRHPTIEDDVVIYAGATILGGDTVVGRGCIIGGNVWLTHSVPPDSVVYHKSEVHIKGSNPFPAPIDFVI